MSARTRHVHRALKGLASTLGEAILDLVRIHLEDEEGSVLESVLHGRVAGEERGLVLRVAVVQAASAKTTPTCKRDMEDKQIELRKLG